MSDKKKNSIESSALNVVPENEKMDWKKIALIQIGIMICVPALMLGGILAESMDFKSAIISCGLGYLLTVVLTIIMGFQGSDLGVPTVVISTSTFGKNGSRIILSSLFAVSLIGWFAMQTNVCGSAFSGLMFSSFGVNIPLWFSTLLWGTIMLITAVFGIKALNKLNNVSVPALLAVSALGMYLAIQKFGLGALMVSQESTMSIIEGAVLTFSFGAVGVVIAADFTRYQKSRSETIKSTVFGILPAGVLMMGMGYIMSKLSGNYDLTTVMADIGIPLLGMIVLVLATWTTNTTNSYSAGIDLVMLFKVKDDKRALMTLIAGGVGTLLAVFGAIDFFQDFLFWVAITFTPIAGIMIADYWIIGKGDKNNWSPKEGMGWNAVIAWIAGVGASSVLDSEFAIIYGMVCSMVLYVILDRILSKADVENETEERAV